MKTDDLIAALAGDTRPVSPHALLRRLLIAAVVGSAITLASVILVYGLRPDLMTAVLGAAFWIKAIFTLSVAALGFVAVERAGRPGVRFNAQLAFLAAPFVFIFAMAASELTQTVPAERLPMWLGHTWRSCPFSIAGLAIPPLVMLLLALRRLAPTRPVATGLVAGLLSGGLAATAYGLHCPERSAAFVATWYVLGILGSGAFGAVLGRRLLRW
jgi:hypothetical protein